MSHPWMPLYVGDYLNKTRRLTTLEHGVYFLLILDYWQNRGLPDDDATLARIVGLSEREWRKLRPVMQTFFDAAWRHDRIDEELARADAKHQKRVDAGRRGGDATASKIFKPERTEGKPAGNAHSNARGNAGSNRVGTARSNARANGAGSAQANGAASGPANGAAFAPASSSDSPSPLPAAQLATPPRGDAHPLQTEPENPDFDDGVLVFLRRDIDQGEVRRVEAALREAAGKAAPANADITPVWALLEKGYQLARDILPVVRARAAGKNAPLASWRYFVPAIVEAKQLGDGIPANARDTAGEAVVWLAASDPRWPLASDRGKRERGKPLLALRSKYENGLGAFVPEAWLAALNPNQSAGAA